MLAKYDEILDDTSRRVWSEVDYAVSE